MKYIAEIDDLEFAVEILDEHHVRFGAHVLSVDLTAISGQPLYSLIVDGESFEGYVYPDEQGWQVHLRGQFYPVQVEDERERRLRASTRGEQGPKGIFTLKAPMPGLIVAVPVQEGQEVEKGQILVVLESMKMQNELRSPCKGTVMQVKVKAGDGVEQKQTLLSVG